MRQHALRSYLHLLWGECEATPVTFTNLEWFVSLQIIFASSGIVQFDVKAEQGGQREHLIVCFLPTLSLNLIYSLFLSAGLQSLRGKKIIISESVTQMLDLDDQA